MRSLREFLNDPGSRKSILLGILFGVLVVTLTKQVGSLRHMQAELSDTKNIDTIQQSTKHQEEKAPEIKDLQKPDLLVLTDKNSVSIRGPIMPDTIAPVQAKLIQLSHDLPKDATIYLVLNTPGGSVDAGLNLIDTAQGLPQKVATVNIFSASMGFHIAEHLDERLVLPHGVMMSHRMAAGMQGQVPGELITRVKSVVRLADKEDALVAKRIGMSFQEYRQLIQDEYWVDGADALHDKIVDRVILARCDESLDGEDKVPVQTLFGTFTLVYARCPLISEPLRVETPKSPSDEASNAKFVQLVEALSHDQSEFVREYIVTGKYTEFLK